jgi:hypothetical protein
VHSSQNFIDLSKCYLFTEFRIRKEDPVTRQLVNLAANEDVAPIQMIGGTFINNLRISINGREIYNSNSLMAYKTYLTHELSYSPVAKISHLTAAGYAIDVDDPTLEAGNGHTARKQRFAGSRTVQCIAKIDADLL